MNRYITPAEVDTETLRRSAKRRRDALTAAGCSTYATGYKNGVPSIVCLCCGLGSCNPNDIQARYCGFCHDVHQEEKDA